MGKNGIIRKNTREFEQKQIDNICLEWLYFAIGVLRAGKKCLLHTRQKNRLLIKMSNMKVLAVQDCRQS